MSERRSGRARKQVDYAKFEADNDHDDDFADPTPPPLKKKKTSEKTEGRREKDKPAKVTSSDKPAGRKGRLPLDDKLYERDLQAALEMSLHSSQSQQDDDDDDDSFKPARSRAILHSTPLVESDQAVTKAEVPEESQSIMPSAIPPGVAADNNIEFLGTVTCSDSESPPSRRLPATSSKRKSSTVYDESTDEEDFSEEDSESDSDFNDADSDFDDGKVKSKSKNKVKGKAAPKQSKATAAVEKKQRSATKGNSKAPPARQTVTTPKAAASTMQTKAPSSVKSVNNRVGTSSAATSSAAVGSRVPTGPHKAPAWTPPGRSDSSSGNNTSLKSPSSGLRLGLSRHARIKPLHPSLKVS